MNIKNIKIKKIRYKLRNIFRREKILARNMLLIFSAIGLFALFIVFKLEQQPESPSPVKEDIIVEDYQDIETPQANTADWTPYQNNWYGFQLKYPQDWQKPVSKNAAKEDKWEYRFEFRKNNPEGSRFAGFDVVIYGVRSIKELSNTDEFPTYKQELNENEICRFITGHLTEKEDFSAEEVYIPIFDDCHNPAFFYTLTRDAYIYNIIPVFNVSIKKKTNLKKYSIDNFPEFFSIAESFELSDIKRPSPQPAQKRITAPMPVAAKRENGRLVCAKKNDKPGKSKQGKKHHLDMECCLDPDEDPNPHCYYDSKKYGKYLK